MKVKSESKVAQSCPTLCNPMDFSPPGSSVPGIFQARVLEWVAIAFSYITLSTEFKLSCLLSSVPGLKKKKVYVTKTKECKEKKKMFVLSSSLGIPDPSLLRDPWSSYQPA